jgi:hypothetical protein
MVSTVLAASWHPRGELSRFFRLLSGLEAAYKGIVVALPPDVDLTVIAELEAVQRVEVVRTENWSWGRFSAVEKALGIEAGRIQYADLDRLLRWVETRPGEWLATLERADRSDCLIIGRTPRAYATHPKALVQTEAISNLVVSRLLGMSVDVSAGAKVFSRAAAEYIVQDCRPDGKDGHALGTDAEWPIALLQAGFRLDYIEVDGLDWESADQYLERAAGPDDQLRAAQRYDADPRNWERRVAVAFEIVETGLRTVGKQVAKAAHQ